MPWTLLTEIATNKKIQPPVTHQINTTESPKFLCLHVKEMYKFPQEKHSFMTEMSLYIIMPTYHPEVSDATISVAIV